MDDLAAARAWFAEELHYPAAVRSPAGVRAFATVPRERFLGPGPWLVHAGPTRGNDWSAEGDTCWLHADGYCPSRVCGS